MTRYQKLMKDENERIRVETRAAWPDADFLFGEDVNYQDIIAGIMRMVTTWVSNVLNYTKV
jgi:hypothetical protein